MYYVYYLHVRFRKITGDEVRTKDQLFFNI